MLIKRRDRDRFCDEVAAIGDLDEQTLVRRLAIARSASAYRARCASGVIPLRRFSTAFRRRGSISPMVV